MPPIVAIDGSPDGGGRTATVLTAVASGAGLDGPAARVVSLAEVTADDAIDAVDAAGAVVFGTPIYRASFAHPLKTFLDQLPRGMWGETRAPLKGKAVCIAATGATLHHFLALDDLRNVLTAFFAAHVVPPGLYVPRDGFDDAGGLAEPYASQAALQGEALAELQRALERSPALRALTPQA